MPQIEFLFGAGASAFSEPDSRNCPPLGKDLFRHMREMGLIPANLPADVVERFENDDNFEHGMQLLVSHDDNESYVPLVRNMARLFCGYIPSLDNVYHRLFERLRTLPVTFHLTTLNYDNLADLCMRAAGFQRPICKPHGSCGFLPQMQGNAFIGPKISGVANSIGGALVVGCQVDRVIDKVEIERWLDDPVNEWLPPVMSFYAPAKKAMSAPEVVNSERQPES